jgi:hypothetical protein
MKSPSLLKGSLGTVFGVKVILPDLSSYHLAVLGNPDSF